MVFDKNLSTNEYEEREKKLRENFKEKEKRILEERTSLQRKIDNLER